MQCLQRKMHYSTADLLLGYVLNMFYKGFFFSPVVTVKPLQAVLSLTRSQLSNHDKVPKTLNHVRLKPKK